MTSELLRRDHVRDILRLYRDAEPLAPGPDRKLRLVVGLERIVGGALAAQSDDEDFGPSRRGRIREYVKTQVSPDLNRLFESMIRHGLTIHPALRPLMQRFGGRRALTARRRELVGDGAWYDDPFFEEHYRACGLDDAVFSVREIRPGQVCRVSVVRAKGERPFSEEERNAVEFFHEQLAHLELKTDSPRGEPRLTPRERNVLDALLRGSSEKQVAAELGMSPQTVHGRVKSIYLAYGVSSRSELLVKCLARGSARQQRTALAS
ncbi:MAG TPA: LuxR C-terminal-related transcriptional regulator [Myxococcaceae bacterium]|nr:LuxR C-terminal-related transcriptional regulator [Myxococcaceae bacterium]